MSVNGTLTGLLQCMWSRMITAYYTYYENKLISASISASNSTSISSLFASLILPVNSSIVSSKTSLEEPVILLFAYKYAVTMHERRLVCQNYMVNPTHGRHWPISSELHFPQFCSVRFSRWDWLALSMTVYPGPWNNTVLMIPEQSRRVCESCKVPTSETKSCILLKHTKYAMIHCTWHKSQTKSYTRKLAVQLYLCIM